ncbi:ATP-binding protein [Methanocella sp. CWC-04]|uniref:Iron-sulfur cluster carrier protein n=1 Tax=Methanooceanicella nereidis TaxID=2052831 RepID=A0AAP2REC5_9EURY|nr:Mrp/NBP35 family ATP-binding protein [Methanocella sp. CWC-04]MCD1294617.1 ATP-binding protein [Methanocella sp. CWC-04]
MSSANVEDKKSDLKEQEDPCKSCSEKKGSSKCDNCPSAQSSADKAAKKAERDERIMKRLESIKYKIAIVSGKGGVGKSTITASLALNFSMMGYRVGVLDADVSGPNIPHLLGVEGHKLTGSELGIEPAMSRNGVKAVSSEMVLSTSDTPMLWRGPMRTTMVYQFIADVNWGSLDFLLVDLPPGTGDEPLSVMQMIPLDGIVIVSTSSNLSVLDVSKIINMARNLEVPILGLVENMSYLQCPDCDKQIRLFGENKVGQLSKHYGVDLIGQVPVDPQNSGVDELPADGRSLIVTSVRAIAEKIVSILKEKA